MIYKPKNIIQTQIQIKKIEGTKYIRSESFTVYGLDFDEAIEKIKFLLEKLVENRDVVIKINNGGVTNGNKNSSEQPAGI